MTNKNPKEERTYVMIKPDGVKKGLIGEVIKRFEQRDLKIVALEMFQPTHEEMDNHYPKDIEWIKRLGGKTLSTYEKYNIELERRTGYERSMKRSAEWFARGFWIICFLRHW